MQVGDNIKVIAFFIVIAFHSVNIDAKADTRYETTNHQLGRIVENSASFEREMIGLSGVVKSLMHSEQGNIVRMELTVDKKLPTVWLAMLFKADNARAFKVGTSLYARGYFQSKIPKIGHPTDYDEGLFLLAMCVYVVETDQKYFLPIRECSEWKVIRDM